MKVYKKKIGIEKYDAVLILSHKRFTAFDSELAQEAKSLDKPFFFIRTHVETEIRTTKRNQEKGKIEFNEADMLKEMREYCHEELKEILASESDIFLIDNYFPTEWDFERLVAGIADVLPERRKECFILSLSNVTRNCLKRKARVLKGK